MDACDALVVGTGFTGAVVARQLHDKGCHVIVVDKRDDIGGNCIDHVNDAGVLVHRYGPHYFRTDHENVFAFLSRFTAWRPFECRARACVNGTMYPFPVNKETIESFFSVALPTEEATRAFLASKRFDIPAPANAEEEVLAKVGPELYEAFFKTYTEKQWGRPAGELDPSVTARIPVRCTTDDRYFDARHQAMPRDGYRVLFEHLLDGIDVRLSTDYFAVKDEIACRHLVFTGRIDEFFGFAHGPLPFRSLRFEHETLDARFHQDWVQVNYPGPEPHTRIVEIKHATGQDVPKTTIVKEYPAADGEPFYPVPSPASRRQHDAYAAMARAAPGVSLAGRLGTYTYMDMDVAVGEALDLADRVHALLAGDARCITNG